MLQCSTLKIQQLAYRGWHQVNRQEELLTGRGRRSGRWNSWRIVSNWNQRARCNCTHAWRWWHRSWFLAGFNSIHPLEKTIQWCLDSSSFSLSRHKWHGSMDWFLNGCWELCVPFYVQVPCLKNNTSSNKENPLAISRVINLLGSSVTSFSLDPNPLLMGLH